MRKDHRFVDTKDTIDKLPEFVLAVMAICEHSQVVVAEWTGLTQSEVSRFINRKAANPTVDRARKFLEYCEVHDPTGRSYKIVQVMNQ